MSRRRSRATPTATIALRWFGYAALIALVLSGTILPAVSYQQSETPRQTALQTASDENALLWMNTSDTVAHNAQSDLVRIENTLGMGTVEVTVTLDDASNNTTLVVNSDGLLGLGGGAEDNESITVEMDENQSVLYELDVSSDESYLGKTLHYEVNVSPTDENGFSLTITRTTTVEGA